MTIINLTRVCVAYYDIVLCFGVIWSAPLLAYKQVTKKINRESKTIRKTCSGLRRNCKDNDNDDKNMLYINIIVQVHLGLENLTRMNANDQSNWPTNRFGSIERHWDRTATVTNTHCRYTKPTLGAFSPSLCRGHFRSRCRINIRQSGGFQSSHSSHRNDVPTDRSSSDRRSRRVNRVRPLHQPAVQP